MELHPQHQALLSRLLQGEAWKVVMHVIGERLAWFETQMQSFSTDRDFRLVLLERRNELLDLVRRLSSQAKEDNPYETAGAALWATRFTLPALEESEPVPEDAEPASPLAPRRRGGSVA